MIDLHLEDPVHRMIAAPTGGGKSYFVGYLVEQLYEKKIPFIILDTKTTNHIGLKTLPDVHYLQVHPRYRGRYNLAELVKYPYILCVPQSRNIDLKDIIDIYRDIVSYLWLHENGKRIFICEEAHNWNKNSSVPDPLFERIAREGRGAEKFIWFITQRLQNFNQLLWSQCGYTYVFHFLIASDIRYVSAMIPGFETRGNQEGLNAQLETHDVLVWDGRKAEIIKAAEIKRKTQHLG